MLPFKHLRAEIHAASIKKIHAIFTGLGSFLPMLNADREPRCGRGGLSRARDGARKKRPANSSIRMKIFLQLRLEFRCVGATVYAEYPAPNSSIPTTNRSLRASR